MKKIQINFTGRGKSETWDIDEENTVGEPAFKISNPLGNVHLSINFESDIEKRRFNEGVGLCRATTNTGKEVYVTGFVKAAPITEACPTCHGTGYHRNAVCPKCSGTGKNKEI